MQNKRIIIINGPNLDILEKREKIHYKGITLNDIEQACFKKAKELDIELCFLQSNREYEIIEIIHDAIDKFDGIIINPAAYSHYSIAILDALIAFKGPIIEVHLSDINKREDFRKQLVTAQAADKVISGKSLDGYLEAIDIIERYYCV